LPLCGITMLCMTFRTTAPRPAARNSNQVWFFSTIPPRPFGKCVKATFFEIGRTGRMHLSGGAYPPSWSQGAGPKSRVSSVAPTTQKSSPSTFKSQLHTTPCPDVGPGQNRIIDGGGNRRFVKCRALALTERRLSAVPFFFFFFFFLFFAFPTGL